MALQEPNARVTSDDLPDPEVERNHYVRVWFMTQNGLDSWDIDNVSRVAWTDESVNIFYDMDSDPVRESQDRYIHVNRDNLVGVKHIRTPVEHLDD